MSQQGSGSTGGGAVMVGEQREEVEYDRALLRIVKTTFKTLTDRCEKGEAQVGEDPYRWIYNHCCMEARQDASFKWDQKLSYGRVAG